MPVYQVCALYLQRPEKGIRSSQRQELLIVVNHHGGAGSPGRFLDLDSLDEQTVL